MTTKKLDHKTESAKAIARRDAAIPKSYLLPPEIFKSLPRNELVTPRRCGKHFTPAELEIVESDVKVIMRKIRGREWSSVKVTEAFCKSAAVANQITNCLTEILFTPALRRAAELDAHLAQTGQLVGPLHGIPISLKDCFVTPPYPSSIGFAVWANQETEAKDASVLPQLLSDLGAVAFVKTNVPTGMMMMESTNAVYHTTLNSHNTQLSSGGSSGGEAALLAAQGSPLGIGTDIGGSIRIPSAFSHLYGLKPSFGRLPTYGTRTGIPGNDFICSVNGPMALSLDSLETYCAVMLYEEGRRVCERDPKCIPLPWRGGAGYEVASGKKLRLAFLPGCDGMVRAHPPVQRALGMAKDAVKAAGHEVLEWEWTDIEYPTAGKLVAESFMRLGGPPLMELMARSGETVPPAMKGYQDAAEEEPLSAERLRDMTVQRNALTKRVLERWTQAKVDAVIAPVSPWCAVREGFTNQGDRGNAWVGYTAAFNVLDLPACTLPVTKARKGDQWEGGSRPKSLNDLDKRVQEDWDAKFYEGAPVGLQCVGQRLMEEEVLGVVRVVRDALVRFGED